MSQHHSNTLLVFLNGGFALALLFLFSTAWRLTDKLDIVANPLLVTKLACCCMVAFHVAMGLVGITKEQGSLRASHAKSKTIRAKIWKWVNRVGVILLSVLVLHVGIILFGAPVIESTQETFHLSSLLACASVLPCVCVIGPSFDSWLTVWTSHSKSQDYAREYASLLTAICSIIGTWIGAFPIPLDWDRDWQVWPISCLVGTLLGHCVGLIAASLSILMDRRRKNRNKLL
jgi:phosphatidylinositol glycan class F